MPSLRELQSAFARGVFAPPDAQLLGWIGGDELEDAQRRLEIYRNSIFANYRSALTEIYPVVQRLVGADFFRQAVDAFIHKERSTSGDLHDWGEGFGAFLASYPGASALAYLPDVARLEWTVHRVFHAAESSPIAIETFATIAPERWAGLRFALAPAARLLASRYPMVRIWEVNQPEFTGKQTVLLAEGGERALVVRRAHTVQVERLGAGEFAMLAGLAAGRPLRQALESAAADADFDLGAFLRHHIPAGTLTDLQID